MMQRYVAGLFRCIIRNGAFPCLALGIVRESVAGVAMFVFQQRRARMHECDRSLALLDGEWMVVGCALTVVCRFFGIRNTWVCMYVWWCVCLKLFEDNICKSETGCNECHLKSAAD